MIQKSPTSRCLRGVLASMNGIPLGASMFTFSLCLKTAVWRSREVQESSISELGQHLELGDGQGARDWQGYASCRKALGLRGFEEAKDTIRFGLYVWISISLEQNACWEWGRRLPLISEEMIGMVARPWVVFGCPWSWTWAPLENGWQWVSIWECLEDVSGCLCPRSCSLWTKVPFMKDPRIYPRQTKCPTSQRAFHNQTAEIWGLNRK